MLQYQVINDANETVVYIKVRISYWIAKSKKKFLLNTNRWKIITLLLLLMSINHSLFFAIDLT